MKFEVLLCIIVVSLGDVKYVYLVEQYKYIWSLKSMCLCVFMCMNTFSCTFWPSICLLGRNKCWVWWCVHPLIWLTVCLSACKFSNTTYLQSFEKVSVLLSSRHSSQGAQVSYSVAPILRCPEVHGGNQEPYLMFLLLATQDPGVFLPLNSIWTLET